MTSTTSVDDHAPGPPSRSGRLGLPASLAVTVGVFLLIGAAVGLIWPQLVSQPTMRMSEHFGLQPVEGDETKLITMDGWYALLGLVACVVAGAVLYTVFRRYGAWTVLALFVGASVGSLLAVVVGTLAGNNEVILAWQPHVRIEQSIEAPVALHAYGVMALWPFAAVLPVLPLIFLLWVSDGPQSTAAVHKARHVGD